MMIDINLEQIKNSHSWKKEYEKYMPLSRFFYRPIGFYLTLIAIKLNLSTEAVSYLSGVIGILAYIFILSNEPIFIMIGIISLHFFNLLDCVDGSIARATQTENPYGKFLDSVIGDFIDFLFFGIIGILTYQNPSLTFFLSENHHFQSLDFLLIGIFSSFFFIFLNHIENLYSLQLQDIWAELQHCPSEGKASQVNTLPDRNRSSPMDLFRVIDRNIRVRETHYFMIVVAIWLSSLDLFLSFYFLYYFLRVFLSFILYVKRAIFLKKLNEN